MFWIILLKTFALNRKLTENCDKLVISSQKFENSESGGFVLPDEPNRVNILNSTSSREMEYVLIHEMAHSFDLSNGGLSNLKYADYYWEDLLNSMEKYGIYDKNHLVHHVCKEANDARLNALAGGELSDYPYSEDFAYCLELLLKDPIECLKRFPKKSEHLYKLLGIIK